MLVKITSIGLLIIVIVMIIITSKLILAIDCRNRA
jgi:hypothetical protein